HAHAGRTAAAAPRAADHAAGRAPDPGGPGAAPSHGHQDLRGRRSGHPVHPAAEARPDRARPHPGPGDPTVRVERASHASAVRGAQQALRRPRDPRRGLQLRRDRSHEDEDPLAAGRRSGAAPAVTVDWTPLVSFPIEWAALSLLVVGAIYWERSALSGIGIEGCFLSALLGLVLAYEVTGDYGIAVAACVGGALVFALLASVLLLSLRADPGVGSFCLSVIPAVVLWLLIRATPLRILRETPSPGL